jgi:leucine-zipper-like transcriptional regulator 1
VNLTNLEPLDQATYIRRRLDVLSPLPSNDFAVFDQSRGMAEDPTPPFLNLPFGAVVGTHFIVVGTYFGPSKQYLSIWALDTLTLQWSEIDAGSSLDYGSWSKGCLWRAFNKLLVFGDAQGSIAQDFGQKISSWEYVVVIDLESFGIYQPPPLELELVTQNDSLNAFEEGLDGDFEIICADRQRIRCSRRLLEVRWPWFRTQISRQSRTGYPREKTSSSRRHRRNSSLEHASCFDLGEAYAVTKALLQYFYALSLLTTLQYVPSVLCRLLEIATLYEIPHLQALAKHAMHQKLSETTCEDFYVVAQRCQCLSLQLRCVVH